jgi:hypothetical protein
MEKVIIVGTLLCRSKGCNLHGVPDYSTVLSGVRISGSSQREVSTPSS